MAVFIQNPEIDMLFGRFGGSIPSKKEDFKPIKSIKTINGEEIEILDNYYVKKPSSKSVREFEEMIRTNILPGYIEDKILMPHLVEVFVGVTLTEEKYFEIDVDNIAKTALDAITGFVFEDDSQVKRVISQKDIHPNNSLGFFISVTKLTDDRKGLMGDFYLYKEEE